MWDNIALLAGYAGFDVRDARARAEGIARHAGVARELSMPLLEVGTTAVLRMVVAVLLECTSSEVVLFLDELPRLDDYQFVQWAAERAAERRREGLTIVQACGERDWPLGMPTRILWLPEDEDAVCGYPESILDRLRRQSLQLESPPPRVPGGGERPVIRGPRDGPANQTIASAMIVRNEAAEIERCLLSFADYR